MLLVGRDLGCVRGGRTVFEGVAFAVPASRALCVTGRNGAGKSSLLRQIAGLVRIAHGTIAIENGDPDSSIAEQAHYLGHLDAALAVLDLEDLADLPAAYLSAGQRRRLSIARLAAVPRPLWLLDEPTSALDASAQARVAELMHKHLAVGGIIVAAVHGPIGLDGADELRLGGAA